MKLLGRNIENMLNNDVPLHTVRTIQGEYGDRSGLYIFVKTGKKTIKGYCGGVALYHADSNPQLLSDPWLIITPDKVKFCIRRGISRWNRGEAIADVAHQVGSLIRVGIFNGLRVNWIRTNHILNCRNDQFICVAPFTLDFDGNLIKLPKKVRIDTEVCLDNNRKINNANARARYLNTAAVKRYRAALESQDWDKVPMDDIFRHNNVEYRTKLIEHFGMDNVIDSLEYAVLDTDTIDGRAYELLEVEMPTITTDTTHRTCNYLRMINPSTGEVCLEGVPAVREGKQDRWSMAEPTVKCALAWRDDDDWFQRTDEKRPNWQTPEYAVDGDGKNIKIGYNKPVVLT